VRFQPERLGTEDETEETHDGGNHPHFAGGRPRQGHGGDLPRAQHHDDELLPLEEEVRRDGIAGRAALPGAGKRNTELKKIVADQMLKIRVLEEVNSKKW
jgi:hypothetical protein